MTVPGGRIVASEGDLEVSGRPAKNDGSVVESHSTQTGRRKPPAVRSLLPAVIAVVAAALIVLVYFIALTPSTEPPVDVYSKPSPPEDAVSSDIVPLSILTYEAMTVDHEGGSWTVYDRTTAVYENGAIISVTKWLNSSYVSQYLETERESYSESDGALVCERCGDDQWLTYSSPGDCAFMWQKGCWLFVAWAEDDDARNTAASELPY